MKRFKMINMKVSVLNMKVFPHNFRCTDEQDIGFEKITK